MTGPIDPIRRAQAARRALPAPRESDRPEADVMRFLVTMFLLWLIWTKVQNLNRIAISRLR